MASAVHRLEPHAYLEWEHTQTERHEYVDGQVFAMAGAKRAHAIVTGNVFAALHAALADGPCRPFVSDMKVRVEKANAFFYPDVAVTCDPRDADQDDAMAYPVLIVEVLSESTAAYDRGEKFARYRLLESLDEYLLIDPGARHADLFRRDRQGNWVLISAASTGPIDLVSVGVTLARARVFAGLRETPHTTEGGPDSGGAV